MSSDMGVVVIAHGRHDHLRRTLLSLAASEVPPDEVVVVAMADPETDDVVAGLPASTIPIRVVKLDCDPGHLQLARARNLGARSITASRLVFLDVDCLAAPRLVGTYRDALDRLALTTTAPVVVSGPVTYLPEGWDDGTTPPQLDWTAIEALRNPHPARPDPAPGKLQHEDRFELFWSLSFALTHADFDRIGGFDEAYEGYGGEDTDLAERLRAAGGTLWWVGGADVWHQYHPVSRPPIEHLDDILRNVAVFQQRWGKTCMDGWLKAFGELGLATRNDNGTWRRTTAAERPGAVLHVVPGPEDHGITRHARQLLAQGGEPQLRIPDPRTLSSDRLVDLIAHAADGRGLHLHLNDTQLGDDTVTVLRRLAEMLPTSLTLHDLPDPREGAGRYARRARAYTDLWRSATGVVVASKHEQGLLADAARCHGLDPADLPPVAVVPLPLADARDDLPAIDVATLEPVVAVLGYVYPGKGHEQALDLAASLGLAGIVALGRPSVGHEQLVDDLRHSADELGVSCEVTGFLSEAALLARARRVALPLAWHAHASASGSIGTWLEAGRRPLVADGGWVRELAERCPDAVTITDDAHVTEAATAALANPTSTVLATGTHLHPTLDEARAATRRAIAEFHRKDLDG